MVYGLLAKVMRENKWLVAVGQKPSEADSGSDSGAQTPVRHYLSFQFKIEYKLLFYLIIIISNNTKIGNNLKSHQEKVDK